MRKKDLQCLFIGEDSSLYTTLLESINVSELSLNVKKIASDNKQIIRSLKKMGGAGILFISDEASFSLPLLSDLIWQYSQDVIVVILTKKTPSTSFKKPLNNIYFSRLNVKEISNESQLFLGSLIHVARIKQDFRQCKRLLGVSEKRCQWLVDSSNEAIAYISRDLHLYSNSVYLQLFNYESDQHLRSIPVQKLIAEDEYVLFRNFITSQLRKHNLNHSFVITMCKKNGAKFRASIVVIPSVFKGSKCLQLWVHPLEKYKAKSVEIDDSLLHTESVRASQLLIKKASNPFEELENNIMQKTQQRVATSSKILKEILKRKEVVISAQKLVEMKRNENHFGLYNAYHLLSLNAPDSLRKNINNLLFHPLTDKSQIDEVMFWDKVKFTQLLQILLKNKRKKNINLLIQLSDVSATDEEFARWLLSNLKRFSIKASNLVMLFPSQLDEQPRKKAINFIKKLKINNCKIALDHFTASIKSLSMLRQVRPDYIRLSLPWVMRIEGNSANEVALASFIRQLESKKIKVIAPCGLSMDMRKLFTLSGVSFCQENTIKTG